ncbi:MAG: acetyl-CoA carboxylase biotin carboxyl carrier protein subunit [Alphaproteobacteria bacterium]|nr:MAG: acetyl-CoA carboxylase biotin carboxyl carrier protein subunit [Alphaproteobacteria bacterium]
MTITRSDIDAILAAFEASDWRSIVLKADGVEIALSKDGATAPAATIAAAAPVSAPAPLTPADGVEVRAPTLGSFYRAPKPGAAPFTDTGVRVADGDELCLIEVMKLFTSVRAPCAGVVTAIMASDGDLVEHGQPLLRIAPDA